jgi:phosphatidate cytidylyltransferase
MKRAATALALVPLITYIILGAPYLAFLAVLTIIAILCFIEYSGIVAAHGVAPPGPLGFIAGLIVLLVPHGGIALISGVALAGMALALRASDLRGELARTGGLVLGVAYIFASWRCAAELRSISPYWLFLAIALNWVGDTAAYFGGRAFGRHKLAPAISPGKTWEGAAASVAGSALFGVLFAWWMIPEAPLWLAVVVSVPANLAGQIGDLCESTLKRGAGLKDSGSMLPGHGGWLDRVDSTLFAVPVAYGLIWLARMMKVA